MRNFFIAALLLLTMTFAGCGNGDANNMNGQKFIIGLDDEYPPMGFKDEKGEIIGFDVDLAKEVGKRMGVEFVFKPIDWEQKKEEITSGKIDILWNGTDITDERKEYMIFTRPYMDNRQILLVKKDNPHNIHSGNDLEGKVVGTQAGSSSRNYVDDTPTLKNSFKEFKTYLNFKEAFAELDSGNVDVLICDEIAARYELSKVPQKFEVVETTIGPVCEIGIGFRKDDTELRDKVQKVFDSMVADGTTKKISEKWFQADLIKYRK
ncbi:MAG: amino acid ABC transporter substrate-binding protein [Selenomonadaceae bacterium]|nr:amino acid ABC transporter substrate-binding protein [Selenomonadaceae bacterium]